MSEEKMCKRNWYPLLNDMVFRKRGQIKSVVIRFIVICFVTRYSLTNVPLVSSQLNT